MIYIYLICLFISFDLFLLEYLEDRFNELLVELGLDGEDPPYMAGFLSNESWLS